MSNDIEILERITVTSFNTSNIYDNLEKVNTAIKNVVRRIKELEQADKQWEKIYDEEEEQIRELNNKIFELEESRKENV